MRPVDQGTATVVNSMLGTVHPRHQRMQVELIGAQIEIAPNALAMVMLGIMFAPPT